ncbi:MAG: GNAT family N-acetyltransferase [Desulfitobacteriaceae bacterium]|jgi:hypothetical protein|nr:GNAT family N-acetyltransferase [Desulfitobacteriaceae bacterium]MDD4297965.1 GNAT family N-acetyltransferase [Ruminiclostridium sp.]
MIRLLKQSDKQIILKYLNENGIETIFLYQNILKYGVENKMNIDQCADYFGFFDEGLLKGILPFYNNGSCIPHYMVLDAVTLFIELMKERNLKSLTGMGKVIRPLHEKLKPYKNINDYRENYYFINRSFKPFILDEINFFNANAASSNKVIDFILGDAIIDEANRFTEREKIRNSLAKRKTEEEYIFAEKDGRLLSQACILLCTPQYNHISGVYTAETERGKGYAKAVVSELCRRITARGKIPTLSVRKGNTPAVKAYTTLGFAPYDDHLIIKYE